MYITLEKIVYIVIAVFVLLIVVLVFFPGFLTNAIEQAASKLNVLW